MKFCTHCGNFVEGKAFCDKCGKPANVGEAEEIVLTQESVLETDGDIAKSSLKPEENEAAQEEAEAEAIPELNADMPEISHSALPAKNILNACNLPFSDICYCVRVATVANRKIHAQNTTLSGLFSSLSTTVNDVISSTMHNTFLVRTKDGNMQLVCEKMETMKFPIAEVGKRTECGFGFLDFFVTFPQGSIEAVSFKVSSENIDTAVYGNLLQLLYDFGNVSDSSFDRVHNEFMHVFHYRLNIYDNLYPFAAADKTSSLLLFGKDGLYIYGKSRKIEYKNIIAHHCENGYALYLVAENDSLEMFEFSKEAVSAFSE